MKYLVWRAVWRALDAALRLADWLVARLARLEQGAEIEMLLALSDVRVKEQQRRAQGGGEA